MGDPINSSFRTPGPSQRLPPPASSSASGNMSNSRSIARPQSPRSGSLQGMEGIDPKGVMRFLQEFPTLEALSARFPEIATMTLPDAVDGDVVASFARVLESVLGRNSYEALTRAHAPLDILRGVAELRARGQDGTTSAGPPRGRQAEQPEERKRRGRPRRHDSSLTRYLINRESGVGCDRHSIYFHVRRAPFVGMAVVANCNPGKLRHYDERIGSLLRSVEARHPEHWGSVSELVDWRLAPSECRAMRLVMEAEPHVGNPVAALDALLVLDEKTLDFFYELLCLEASTRFLQAISGGRKLSEETDLCEDVLAPIVVDLSREVLLSALLVTRQFGPDIEPVGRKEFQAALIASLITLYETGNLGEARTVFISAAGSSWPDIPRRDDTDSEAESVGNARVYSERAVAYFETIYSGTNSFSESDAKLIREFSKDIFYYFFLRAGSKTSMHAASRSLLTLLTCAKPGNST